jgi:hypothetical protein
MPDFDNSNLTAAINENTGSSIDSEFAAIGCLEIEIPVI